MGLRLKRSKNDIYKAVLVIIVLFVAILVNSNVTYAVDNVNIINQPKDYVGKAGDKFTASVKAEGNGLSYQWQSSYDGGKNWKNSSMASGKTSIYSFIIGAGDIGMYYRCVVKDKNGNSVTSEAHRITGVLKITEQPKDYAGKAGDKFTASVKAEGNGLSYQWQSSYDGGKNWKNSSMASGKTSTYSFTMGAGDIGMYYRCVVKDQYGNTLITNICILRGIKTDDWELPIM